MSFTISICTVIICCFKFLFTRFYCKILYYYYYYY